MGSYISVHNNTRDKYNVRVGIDEAAVRVFNIVAAAIAGAMLIIAGAGVVAGKLSVVLLASGKLKIMGLTNANLLAVTSIASVMSSGKVIAADAAGLAIAISILVSQELEDEGFVPINPNAQHKFGRFTLSLWRQATCRRVRPDPNNPEQVLIDTVYMRPIFSGATNNSTLVHDIQFWINRWGHENLTVLEVDPVSASAMPMDETSSAQLKDIDWHKVIVETRAKAKKEMLEKEGIDLHLQEKYA